ncbi:RNA-guided endonuclease InsQ/TnpB family protein [Iningainema tapete]|uniref:IS200/IS605 family element transposase accessory protein TnpB n=1 Tax=Iningainema tapete BLCC-T55 TaxID=2748662 RepID=A0A8J6XEV6_9CYAN|nr:RNA-guided endonuclease TnpB family protein [Iningainema tapete]MBD2771206.1 IS200/IS605 family element transposase accessory protein TnpB [Iningainema tapete BLCC-T55]
MTDIIQTQLIRINLPEFETNILEFICRRSNSLWNQAIYYTHKNHELTHPTSFSPNVSYEQLAGDLKDEQNYKLLYSQVAQQTLKSVAEGFKSFKELLLMWRKGELPHMNGEPRPPKYRKKGGLFQVSYPAQALTFELDSPFVRVPLGQELTALEGVQYLYLPCPFGIQPEQICELTIIPRNREFYAVYSYKKQPLIAINLDKTKALGIDHGRDNWLTCVSNIGTSFIVDGLEIKSINQWHNKRVATIKEGKEADFWNNRLAKITEKRNRQMRDAVNKAARLVIDHCLENGISTVVFGWNPGQKQRTEMGKIGNQSFVQIPTGRLKERIKQMCDLHGIQFVETEEAYTSKSSFVDGDELPKHGEKPIGYKPSGKRVKRGLFRTGLNWYINADCNGAANCLRKVSTTLGLVLDGVSRGSLATPARLRIWNGASKRPLPGLA